MSRHSRVGILFATMCAITLAMWPLGAQAQHRGGRGHDRRSGVVVRGFYGGPFYDPFFYDPFWGPYAWGAYAWGPYGYAYTDGSAQVRMLATPKDAEVYVDGYYAGVVDDFSGVFHRLKVRPGGHELVLYHDGFQTVHQAAYLQPDSTLKLRYTMVPLAPGQQMKPKPLAARPLMSSPPIEERAR